MASPILKKLSPKSPIAFTQSLTKSLSVGFAAQTTKRSPQNYLNANNVQKPIKASPENFLSPRLVNTVFAGGRKSDGGGTPNNPLSTVGPSPVRFIFVADKRERAFFVFQQGYTNVSWTFFHNQSLQCSRSKSLSYGELQTSTTTIVPSGQRWRFR